MIRAVARRAATFLALALSPVLFLLSLHLDTTAPEAGIVGVGVASLLLIAGLLGIEPGTARRGEKTGIAAIRGTWARRAAMVAVVPALIVWRLGPGLLLGALVLPFWALRAGFVAIADEVRVSCTPGRSMRALFIGLRAMWSDTWSRDPDAAIAEVTGRRLQP